MVVSAEPKCPSGRHSGYCPTLQTNKTNLLPVFSPLRDFWSVEDIFANPIPKFVNLPIAIRKTSINLWLCSVRLSKNFTTKAYIHLDLPTLSHHVITVHQIPCPYFKPLKNIIYRIPIGDLTKISVLYEFLCIYCTFLLIAKIWI